MITTDVNWFNTFVIAWIVLAMLLFPVLFFVKAPYGRHSSGKWGPLINNRLGWILMESPSLIVFSILFLSGPLEKESASWIFFGCWVFHYFNRSFIYPFRIRSRGKKMPLIIAGSAIFFNIINGGIVGYFLGFIGPVYPDSWLITPQFFVGFSMYIAGSIINWHSDQILFNLRKPGESGYKIPKGGLFRYVTSPNYFGEIIEWTGFAIMLWALPAFSFAIWTFCNLIPRAYNHHKWYNEEFGDEYPQNRKVVIPGIL